VLLGEQWISVCALDRLMARTILCTRVAGVDLILVWNGDRAVACDRTCPHEQADLLRLYPVRVAVGEVWIDAEAIRSSSIR
jgi:hypothetical protein